MSPHTHSASYVTVGEKKNIIVCRNYVLLGTAAYQCRMLNNKYVWRTYIYRNIGIFLCTSTWTNGFLFNH